MKSVLPILLGLVSVFYNSVYGQNHGDFNGDAYPVYLIDSTIVKSRNLGKQMSMLSNDCDWELRIGKNIDVFWLSTENGNLFGHVYEYFMNCDNLRLIYWYASPQEKGKIIDFMIEPLEENSDYITSNRKYLKNQKKYQIYLQNK